MIGLFSPLWVQSPKRGRRLLRMYADPSNPIFMRNGLGMTPFVSISLIIPAPALLLPKSIGVWSLLIELIVAEILYLVAYFRVPGPLLPRWILDEVKTGAIELARPGRRDRSTLRVSSIGFAVAAPVMLWLIVTGRVSP